MSIVWSLLRRWVGGGALFGRINLFYLKFGRGEGILVRAKGKEKDIHGHFVFNILINL